MPELPEIQALAERLGDAIVGTRLSAWEAMGFAGLKTVEPGPDDLLGAEVVAVGRRGKFLVVTFDNGIRVLVHLGQAGRVDIEEPVKATRPRGSVFRLVFDATRSLLFREHGHERRAGWWVLAPGDEGPLAALGPEVVEDGFAEAIRTGDSSRHLHTMLRDQHFAAGVGRGYADDALHRAQLSPFVSLRSLSSDERERLIAAVEEVLAEALQRERQRTGGLSAAKLGDRFEIHNRYSQPCPRCGRSLERVSYASHEIVYCPTCQTDGRVYADRRMSKLLR
jgi:formamidopyrimidine-DNA glycosylase